MTTGAVCRMLTDRDIAGRFVADARDGRSSQANHQANAI
jgi:hypothetical protein